MDFRHYTLTDNEDDGRPAGQGSKQAILDSEVNQSKYLKLKGMLDKASRLLPTDIKRELMTDDLISNLAQHLIKEDNLKLINEMFVKQDLFEKKMKARRDDEIERLNIMKKHKQKEMEMQFVSNSIGYGEVCRLNRQLQEHYECKVNKIDLGILKEYDELVAIQQQKLQEHQFPYFELTQDVDRLRLQSLIISLLRSLKPTIIEL